MREKIKAHLEELIQQVKEKYPGSIRLRRIFEIDGVSVPVVYIRKVFVDDISAEEGIEVASLYHNWPKWGCAVRPKRFVKTVKKDISIDAVVDHIAMWIDTHKERDKELHKVRAAHQMAKEKAVRAIAAGVPKEFLQIEDNTLVFKTNDPAVIQDIFLKIWGFNVDL